MRGREMTFEEKGTWIQAVMLVAVAVVYAVIVIGEAQDTPVSQIAYEPVMIWCTGISDRALDHREHRGRDRDPGP